MKVKLHHLKSKAAQRRALKLWEQKKCRITNCFAGGRPILKAFLPGQWSDPIATFDLRDFVKKGNL